MNLSLVCIVSSEVIWKMKETTRQLILLMGVLTLLTNALVIVNYSNNQDTSTSPSENPKPVNNTENDSGQETPEDSGSGSGESQTLVGQSISGWQALYKDIQVTMEDLLGLGNSTDSS